jgi:hypothetical protein
MYNVHNGINSLASMIPSACNLVQAAEASKNTRDALLRVKRLKRGPVEAVSNPSAGHVQPESPQTKVQQLVTTLNTASLAQKAKLRAISALRRILSTGTLSAHCHPPLRCHLQGALVLAWHLCAMVTSLFAADDPPFEAAIWAGAGTCLIKALLLR